MSDRKYGQRGYQQGDRDRDRERSSPGPRREPPMGPRGRGLGKPTLTVFRCAVCGEKQRDDQPINLESTCWKCHADLHTCTHCRHFDSSAPGECRRAAPDYVASKAKQNICGLFEPKAAQEVDETANFDKPSDAKTAFDALFKF